MEGCQFVPPSRASPPAQRRAPPSTPHLSPLSNGSPETETHPVSQPLRIVARSGSIQSLTRQVSGDSPANQVGNGGSESKEVEEDENDETATEGEDGVRLLDLGLGFELVQDGELGELQM